MPAIFALCAKCDEVVVKDRSDALVAAFFVTLADEHAAFANVARARAWRGGEDSAEAGIFARADTVVAFGGEEALRAVRAHCGSDTRFVPFGHRAGIGVLARDAAAALDAASAERIARDALLYDGEGCLSLHALFVEGGGETIARASAVLAAACERVAVEFPGGTRSPQRVARVARYRDAAAFRAASGHGTVLRAADAVLVVDPPRGDAPPFLPRVLPVIPVAGDDDVVAYVARASPAGAGARRTVARRSRRRARGTHRRRARGAVRLDAGPAARRASRRPLAYRGFRALDRPRMIPGPRSRALAAELARYEAPGVTYLAEDYPVFWARAFGATVEDVDGNAYIDLTSAFGVATTGHTNPRVVDAVIAQARALIHGMGDVHPTEVRTRLLARLAAIAPGGLCKTYLATSGAEAIEFALKTALLATGKPRAIAYTGAYHGLSLGALEVAGIEKFRAPFAPLVAERATLLPYPGAASSIDAAMADVRDALARDPGAGAIVVEPIQGRAGVVVPPDGFLRGAARAVRRMRAAADPGRDLHGPGPNRHDVRVRARAGRAGPAVHRQGARRRRAAVGDDRNAARDGRVAAQHRRSAAHDDVPR